MPERGLSTRIIATANAFPVPPAWIEQLAPGRRLVLDLRGPIGGGLMVVAKQEDGTAQGRFLAVKETISFLGLRATAEGETHRTAVDRALLDEQALYEPGTGAYACAEHFCSSYERFRGEDDAFNVWVQCRFPALAITWMNREARAFARLVDGASGTVLVSERCGEQMGVAVQGARNLWEELVRAYEEWLVLEKPGREGCAGDDG